MRKDEAGRGGEAGYGTHRRQKDNGLVDVTPEPLHTSSSTLPWVLLLLEWFE